MTDDGVITNRMLLDHMQAMKHELIERFNGRFNGLEVRVDRLEQKVERGFEEARQHRQALQEDLDATIRLQGKHSEQLAQLSS